MRPPWKAGERFALLGRTASKPSRFPGPGSRASGASKPSRFPDPRSRAQPRVRFRETGASLYLTPTDRIHKENNMVVERRDTEEMGEMILALAKPRSNGGNGPSDGEAQAWGSIFLLWPTIHCRNGFLL